jgi:hypothetical protein
MKTNEISVLQNNNFSVEKTRSYTTIVSSNVPFNIHGESGVIAASLNEQQKYTVVFNGLCNHGKTPYLIEQSKFPMVAEAHQRYLNKQREPVLEEAVVNETLPFTEIANGEVFSKNADQKHTYRKVSETTYVKVDSLIETLELIATDDMLVYVVESSTSLTADQKRMIVDSLPEDLQRYEFDEVLGMTLEDVPGVETMSTHAVARLHKELYQMYIGGKE